MKKHALTPKFNMTYGELLTLADDVKKLAERDAVELKEYGITHTSIAALQTKIEAFRAIESDVYHEGQVSVLTRNKNAIRNTLQEKLSSMMVRVKNLYGQNSPEYARFGTTNAQHLSDSDFVRMLRTATRVAEAYKDSLATKGFTDTHLEELSSQLEAFDEAITEKHHAEKERDTATQKRAQTANELYDIVSEICDYGKDYYFSRDEAKYNDYVIYDTPAQSPQTDTTGGVGAG